jgi:hypothetical protein
LETGRTINSHTLNFDEFHETLVKIRADLANMISIEWRVWRYQRGNQKPEFEEGQTTQWPKEEGQKDKQWSIKHTHKTKDRLKPH